jgi:hypothetical protein
MCRPFRRHGGDEGVTKVPFLTPSGVSPIVVWPAPQKNSNRG